MLAWLDKKFDFTLPVENAPFLLERLRGTPARLEDRLRGVPRDVLTRRDGDKWSIQEHAGHFADVEALFVGRLDDYDAQLPRLRAADVSGRKTYNADHNKDEIAVILARFRKARGELVARLEGLDERGFARTAFHPRLERPMRVCDMMLFESEHDDHHLAAITRLLRSFGGVR